MQFFHRCVLSITAQAEISWSLGDQQSEPAPKDWGDVGEWLGIFIITMGSDMGGL